MEIIKPSHLHRVLDISGQRVGSRLETQFIAAVMAAPFTTEDQWSIAGNRLDVNEILSVCGNTGAVQELESADEQQMLVLYMADAKKGGFVWLRLENQTLRASVSGGDRSTALRIMAALRQALPEENLERESAVWVDFWYYGPHGPAQARRKIVVPEWVEIASNYPAQVRPTIHGLVGWERPPSVGQLLLWHGSPGTGKTYALRALTWGWRKWCSFHYITDPDHFFGDHADYLMQVLLAEGNDEDNTDDGKPASSPQWRLLILEDAGEFMAVDARERTKQGFSRFLNVVDGLLGQGLRILLLMTSNEDLGKFHPAPTRPGRCVSRVEFLSFGRDEAAAWFAGRGDGYKVGRAMTLAELYAAVSENRHPAAAVVPGFVAGGR